MTPRDPTKVSEPPTEKSGPGPKGPSGVKIDGQRPTDVRTIVPEYVPEPRPSLPYVPATPKLVAGSPVHPSIVSLGAQVPAPTSVPLTERAAATGGANATAHVQRSPASVARPGRLRC